MVRVNLHGKGRPTDPQHRRRRLDFHCPWGAAGDIAGDDGQSPLAHVGEHRTPEVVRVELKLVERKLTVRASGEHRIVDKSYADRTVGTGFDDVLDEQHVPDIRRPALTRA